MCVQWGCVQRGSILGQNFKDDTAGLLGLARLGLPYTDFISREIMIVKSCHSLRICMLRARMASCKSISLNPQKCLVRWVPLSVITITQMGTVVSTGSQGWYRRDCGRGSRRWAIVMTMEKQREAPLRVQVTSNQEVKGGWKRAWPSNDFYEFSKVTIRSPLLKRLVFSVGGILWPVLIHKIFSLLIPWAEWSTLVYSGAVAVAGVPGFMLLLRWGHQFWWKEVPKDAEFKLVCIKNSIHWGRGGRTTSDQK